MNGTGFDQLSRMVGTTGAAGSRRQLLRGLGGAVLAGLVGVTVAEEAAAHNPLATEHPLTTDAQTAALVLADPERIGQVLRNLVGNAAKHTPPGTRITVRACSEGDRVRLEVADQGPGIHPDDLARIFAKFGRGRDSVGRGVSGVGLGLYLSRRIIQAHGADLTVSSPPEGGAVFAFSLPVAV